MKEKTIKRLRIAFFVIIIGIILLWFFKPNLIYLYYKKDLENIAVKFEQEDMDCLIAFNNTPVRYYSGYNEIEPSEVSEDLRRDIENIFDDGVIKYMGNTCLIDGVLYWDEFCVRIDDDGRKFLVYSPDPHGLPNYSDYGPISWRWVGGDWFYVSVRNKKYMKK